MLDSSGQIAVGDFSDSKQDFLHDFHGISDDQFLSRNPKIKQTLIRMKEKLGMLGVDWGLILQQEDVERLNELIRCQNEEDMIMEKRRILIQTIEKLSTQKRVLKAQLQTRIKLESDKKQVSDRVVSQFNSSQKFKFIIKINNPLPTQPNVMESKEQQLFSLLTLVESGINKKLAIEQKRNQQLTRKIQQMTVVESKPQSPRPKVLVTREEQIKSKEDCLNKLKEQNFKLRQQLKH